MTVKSRPALSISDLNYLLKQLLDAEPLLSQLAITGTITQYRHYAKTGAHYITLSDDTSTIQAIAFKLDTVDPIKPGQLITAIGRPTFYPKRGTLQFQIHAIKPLKVSPLTQAFEALKAQLNAEGLFAPERKKPIPTYPKCITLITASPSAALSDFLNLKRQLAPHLQIQLIPVSVQGAAAPTDIAAACHIANAHETDLVVVLRGGGSAEDLAAFNDERVVRAIAQCTAPTMSAIGHDIDVSLADFVADHRSATPSSAIHTIAAPFQTARTTLCTQLRTAHQHTTAQLTHARQRVITALDTSTQTLTAQTQALNQRVSHLLALADSHNPLKKLAQGYSITHHNQQALVSIATVQPGDSITTRVSDGDIISQIQQIQPKPSAIAKPSIKL
jgi:exodeoxyribonuclease VII large subunit